MTQTLHAASRLRNFPRHLKTARVTLTPIEASDGPELWNLVDASREHLEQWLPWVPRNNTPEASQRFADGCASDWRSLRALRWGIRARHTGALLGMVGLECWVHATHSCDLGYWLSREACGTGLMTEAAAASIDFGFRHAGLHRIRCAAATENQHSLAVIARLGFLPEGVARQAELVQDRWLDHAVFGKLSTD